MQVAEMGFLNRVAGRTPRDRLRSSVTREELRVEPLLLPIESGQPFASHASWTTFRRGVTEEAQGKTRKTLEGRWYRLAWERLRVPVDELEEMTRGREQEEEEEEKKYLFQVSY